jgi:hypothetical protein
MITQLAKYARHMKVPGSCISPKIGQIAKMKNMSGVLVFPGGARQPNLNEIHSAVAKRAPLTDDDDAADNDRRRHVIV